jgi:hypothetical protein
MLAGALLATGATCAAGAAPGATDVQVSPPRRRWSPWQSDRASWFAQTANNVGIVYARPRLTVGYGAPFWSFVGVDTWMVATNSFVASYVGWRANLPFADVQLGGRHVQPFDRRLLPRQASYEPEDLPLRPGAVRSSYTAIDLEVLLVAPVLHGGVFTSHHSIWVDIPRDRRLYEETYRVVMDAPYMHATRSGWVYGFGESQAFKIGGALEYHFLPGREADVIRAGPVALYDFDAHLQLQLAWTGPVAGPDSLGLYEGSYATFGVQHRFARRF